MIKKTGIIITAGGAGLRMKSKIKKQYMEINGFPVLYYSLKTFDEYNFKDKILVVPQSDLNFVSESILKKYGFKNYNLTAGGETRHHSVYNGLQKINGCKYILIHDGVRPFTTKKTISNVLKKLFQKNIAGVIPVINLKDTIKKINNGKVVATLDRSELAAVQTPQGFNYKILAECYNNKFDELSHFTDDASILEKNGFDIYVVEGDETNIKITTGLDITYADYYLSKINKPGRFS